MNSCLYECDVLHHRFAPKPHRFVYRIFLFALDLDELDTLHHRLRLFSVGKRNFYSFRERDFFPSHERLHNPSSGPTEKQASPGQKLKERVSAHLAAHGIDLTGGRVVLVTLPRVAGYLFNPVSFYFCYDRTGAAVASIAEVTNTFREVKAFTLTAPQRAGGSGATFRLRAPKHFYVSPFSDVDVQFEFILRTPGGRLAIQIDDYAGDARTLTSTLTGPRRELTDATLAWFTLRHPLPTLRIITLIHWHALQLWLKRLPWFRKSARSADQRDLRRPHASLVPHQS